MVTRPNEALSRLPQYNSDFYDVNTNPLGMADGGHIPNFPMSLKDLTLSTNYVAELAAEIDMDAEQVAADRVQTGQDRAAAARSAAAAETFNPELYVPRESVAITNADNAPLGRWSHFAGSEEQAVAARFPALGGVGTTSRHWNVFTHGLPTRQVQILSETFGLGTTPGRLFTRSKHDSDWRPYRENFSTAGGLLLGRLDVFSGAADRAGLNVGQRGTAPTTPANGDVWALATGIWSFLGGVVRQVYDTTSLPAPSNSEIDAGSSTLRKAWSVLDVWRAARAAIPLVSQAIAEAGVDTTAFSWSSLRIRQAAIAASKEVLVASYTAAQLDGLSSIIQDMPAGFNKYRIEFGGIRLRSGTSIMTVRNGPSGGALNEGATAYVNVVLQQRGATTDAVVASNNAWVVAALATQADAYGEIIINDQPGQFWIGEARYAGIDNNNDTFVSMRGSRYAPGSNGTSRWGRFALIFGAVLAAGGYVRIYGVRT